MPIKNIADYENTLSPLAQSFHKHLHSEQKLLKVHALSVEKVSATKNYRTKSSCEAAKRDCMQPEYQKAQNHFSINSPTCLATEAAEYYSERIDDYLTPLLDALNIYCKKSQQETIYQKILELYQNSKEYLLNKFSEVLTADPAYYSLDRFEDYLEMAEVEKYDSRLEDEHFLWRLLDAIVSEDAITYSYAAGAFQAIAQMERDLAKRCERFYKIANSIYEDYIQKIVLLVDSIGHGLPELEAP